MIHDSAAMSTTTATGYGHGDTEGCGRQGKAGGAEVDAHLTEWRPSRRLSSRKVEGVEAAERDNLRAVGRVLDGVRGGVAEARGCCGEHTGPERLP